MKHRVDILFFLLSFFEHLLFCFLNKNCLKLVFSCVKYKMPDL